MKFFKTYLAAFTFFCTLTASAQSNVNIVKLGGNLLSLLPEGQDETIHTLGGLTLSLEHQISRKFSLACNVNWNNLTESQSIGEESWKFRTTISTFEPEIRWYPKVATKGFYLGLSPALYLFHYKYSGAFTASGSETQFGIALKTGYQFALSPKLKLQIGTGFGAILPNQDIDPLILFNLNALVGYQF